MQVTSIKRRILISAPVDFLPDLKDIMSTDFDCVFAYGAGREEIETLLSKHEFDAWLVGPCPTYFIGQELIDRCQSLKIIATPSTGSNHVDVAYLQDQELGFFALKGTEIVEQIYASSEFTFNLMISVIRKTPYAFQAVLDGNWREAEYLYRGRELDGLTLGIIGFGRIGRNLSRYSQAFRMRILAYDPYVSISTPGVEQIRDLPLMLLQADVVAVCVHLNDETFKMVNNAMFDDMKNGVYFINTSRGDVVDEKAFIEYLQNGKILAAGVDVISDEFTGVKDQHPLIQYARTHDNLIVTPHIAGLTYDSERKAQTAAYEAIKNYLEQRI